MNANPSHGVVVFSLLYVDSVFFCKFLNLARPLVIISGDAFNAAAFLESVDNINQVFLVMKTFDCTYKFCCLGHDHILR